MQHKLACDKIVERLETKSSRGEGPNRVLRKILKHFDQTDGQLLLSADDFMQAMERVGTKLSSGELDLLLTVSAMRPSTGSEWGQLAIASPSWLWCSKNRSSLTCSLMPPPLHCRLRPCVGPCRCTGLTRMADSMGTAS